MDPAVSDSGLAHLVLLRQPQPAEQQAPPLTVSGGLRRIEFEAPVQLVEGPVLELLAIDSAWLDLALCGEGSLWFGAVAELVWQPGRITLRRQNWQSGAWEDRTTPWL